MSAQSLVAHFADAPVKEWAKRNLLQGMAYAKDPTNGQEYLFIAQARSGGAGRVEDSLYHRHLLVDGKLDYLDTMVVRRLGHPQNFHVRISVRSKPWVWGTATRYLAGRRVGTRVARFPYLPGTAGTDLPGFTYIEGLPGNSLSPISSPYTQGRGRITVRRARALTETYTEYREADLLNGRPRALRSFSRKKGPGVYQSSAASPDEVAVFKGATEQKHTLYRYAWDGQLLADPVDITRVLAPTGPNTSSEAEAVAFWDGALFVGKRYNSTDRRIFAIFRVNG
jgi:hypothetical protein